RRTGPIFAQLNRQSARIHNHAKMAKAQPLLLSSAGGEIRAAHVGKRLETTGPGGPKPVFGPSSMAKWAFWTS
ncbi:MAG: hypothetical protein JW741_01930, partial [Sedimentisphaerales bacterium]|nr:hypothetical protein [Sedimentisphaerales bacterium]